MSTWSKAALAAVLGLVLLSPARAQERLSVNFPADAPVTLVSADWGSSGVTPRGGAMLVELNTSLRLRNDSPSTIRGVTLLVLAQEVTPGGKASVTVPSLSAAPGEIFPVRIDLRLLRPLQAASGPLVRVELDGVLFDDLSFYGPNQLNSRRAMIAWEMEARRDREYFRNVLAKDGPDALRKEVLASLARQAERPRLDVQVARRTTVAGAGRNIQFAFVQFPDAPVEPLTGMARLTGQEAGDARLEVKNRSDRAVRYLEIEWLVQDRQGHEYVAGSLPAQIELAPNQTLQIASETALRFPDSIAIEGMRGFLSQVEFADGEVWIPSRASLSGDDLDTLLAPSPEEQRLTGLYRRQGLEALIAELDKF